MNRFSNLLITSLILAAVSTTCPQATANSYRHIQELALDVMIKSDRLMGETHHYVRTPYHQQMIRCVSDMRQKAVRVHVLAIQKGCLVEMAEALHKLDRQYHRVEALFDEAELEASHGHGEILGSTCHVKEHLKRIEDCIHHIGDDIAQMTRPVYRTPYSGHNLTGRGYGHYSGYGNRHARNHQSRNYPYHRSAGVQYDRGGISFRDKNFSFRIGF